MKIGIINNGMGNLGSVYSAFKFYNYDVSLINNPNDLDKTDFIVLAGVGNFASAVLRLKELKFWDKLKESVIVEKKPILGICLGMQLFASLSYENGENEGFGFIKGKVVKIDGVNVRIPHIGWDEVVPVMNSELFKDIKDGFFYFMHSYHFIPEDKNTILSTTKFSNFEVVSAIKKDNIIGVQFHPEKSQIEGLRFIRNFVEVIK